jgi:phosphonate transport system substrate-binding protein
VKLKLFPTYIEVCRSLASGDINAAFLGSLAYATVRSYVDVLARPEYDGISTYQGVIFVRADSGIEGLEQMRGKRFVMGGKTTTAGYVFPLFYFKKQGILNYEDFFSDAFFVGTHEDAILAVLHNKADVGAAKDLIYRMIASENPLLESALKILTQSPPVPSNAFVLRKEIAVPCFDCHQGMAHGGNMGAAIKEYLLTMSQDPEGRQALTALGNATGFLETNDSDYSELYKMLEEINLNPEDLLGDD